MDFIRENTLEFENHHLDTRFSHLLTASPMAPSQQKPSNPLASSYSHSEQDRQKDISCIKYHTQQSSNKGILD